MKLEMKVIFWHADKGQSFYKFVISFLYPKYPKYVAGNIFAIY